MENYSKVLNQFFFYKKRYLEAFLVFFVSFIVFILNRSQLPTDWDSLIYALDTIYNRYSSLHFGRPLFSLTNQLTMIPNYENAYLEIIPNLMLITTTFSSLFLTIIFLLFKAFYGSTLQSILGVLVILLSPSMYHIITNITPDAGMYFFLSAYVAMCYKFIKLGQFKYFILAIVFFSLAFQFKEQSIFALPTFLTLYTFSKKRFTTNQWARIIVSVVLFLIVPTIFFLHKLFLLEKIMIQNFLGSKDLPLYFFIGYTLGFILFFFNKNKEHIQAFIQRKLLDKLKISPEAFVTTTVVIIFYISMVIFVPFLRDQSIFFSRYGLFSYVLLAIIPVTISNYFIKSEKHKNIKVFIIFIPILTFNISNTISLKRDSDKFYNTSKNIYSHVQSRSKGALLLLSQYTSTVYYIHLTDLYRNPFDFIWPGKDFKIDELYLTALRTLNDGKDVYLYDLEKSNIHDKDKVIKIMQNFNLKKEGDDLYKVLKTALPQAQ
ncbi:glycosyltransferase family 39 protein [Halobacteriovorax sp. HLS]|uniref:glycosyltransferase family 39 protein n=1 Tax=Halobacteriovorax sp. HLS TaxID=2234000 RepID=UPI000FDB0F82|nr:glycosyltransferase family 39 protein [Halobacteriovorax sp. HLS]